MRGEMESKKEMERSVCNFVCDLLLFHSPVCKPRCGPFDRSMGTGTSGGPGPFGSGAVHLWFKRKRLTLGMALKEIKPSFGFIPYYPSPRRERRQGIDEKRHPSVSFKTGTGNLARGGQRQ